jgi:hypothetical protein
VRVELDRHSAVSRWRFVRGLPLVLERPARLPVGCLTLSSTRPGATSVLNRLPAQRRVELHRGLTQTIVAARLRLLEGAGSGPGAKVDRDGS